MREEARKLHVRPFSISYNNVEMGTRPQPAPSSVSSAELHVYNPTQFEDTSSRYITLILTFSTYNTNHQTLQTTRSQHLHLTREHQAASYSSSASTNMSQQYDWLVQIPDKPNALRTRLDNRPAHLSHNKPQIEAGKIVFGGPTLSRQRESEDEGYEITGSVTLFRASSEEEVWDMVKADPYAKIGVWDLDRVVVTPFWCAVRIGM